MQTRIFKGTPQCKTGEYKWSSQEREIAEEKWDYSAINSSCQPLSYRNNTVAM